MLLCAGTRLALVLLVLVAGCGEAPPPTLAPSWPEAELPPVSDSERAHFAIERFRRGPLPRTASFSLPDLHPQNLDHARRDLLALPEETRALLADPELIEALTGPDLTDRNPWQNVLEVLAALPGTTPDLVEPWTRPALAVENDIALYRRAVRALAATSDVEVAPLLLAFLQAQPGDRMLVSRALRPLIVFGSPWRERALGTVHAHGGAQTWPEVAGLLALDEGAVESADLLAWWNLLAETGGPRQVRMLSRSRRPAWSGGALGLDDSVWPRDPDDRRAATAAGRLLAPGALVDASGSLPLRPPSPVWPVSETAVSGRLSAAAARCELAERGAEVYLEAVRRDVEGNDPQLSAIAEACRPTPDPELLLEIARSVVQGFLAGLESGSMPSAEGLGAYLGSLVDLAPTEGLAATRSILFRARPSATYQDLLVAAHDILLHAAPDALVEDVEALSRSERVDDQAVAAALMRRGRLEVWIPAAEALLERVPAEAARGMQALLIWLHTAPGVDERRLAAFAPRYAAWMRELPDADAIALAPGLLDLGAPGARATIEGLLGPRRLLHVLGLGARSNLVPHEVAAALIGPLDASTSPAERRAILSAAYRCAPSSAAPVLAAARLRLDEATRAETDDVIEVLRHRAVR